MIKKNKRIIALVMSVSVFTTSIILPSKSALAIDNIRESILNENKDEENKTNVNLKDDKSSKSSENSSLLEEKKNLDEDKKVKEEVNSIKDKSDNKAEEKIESTDNEKNEKDKAKDKVKDERDKVNGETKDEAKNEKDEVKDEAKEEKDEVKDSKKIEDVRKLKKGEESIVCGVVSFNDRNQTLHIEDSTGGIALSNKVNKIDFKKIKKGNLVKVKGTRDTFNGLEQLQASEIEIVQEKETLEPENVTINDLLSGKYDSKYIKIENATIDTKAKKLTQGKDSLDIYFVPKEINVKTGDVVNVEGTMGRYNKTIQIYGSSCTFTNVNDLGGEDGKEKLVINHTKIEKADINNDLTIEAGITGGEAKSVELNYRIKGFEEFKKLEMNKGSEEKYTATIKKENLDLKGIEYYIVAKYVDKESKTETYSVTIIDEKNLAPEVYDLQPAENSKVGMEALPQIKASFKSDKNIDINSIKIFLDDEDVTLKAKKTESGVEYTPSEKLKYGPHKVKIVVSDMSRNATTKEWTFRVAGNGQMRHLFGQLHSHTNISDGTGSLDEAYTWARDHGADYFAVTDHSNWFDNDTSANLADGSASEKWTTAHKTADKYNKENTFSAIYGYEMTWSGSTGGWGHINTFNTPGFETRTNKAMDLPNYYKTIQSQPQSISQLNHPGKTFGDFADFGFYSEGADKYVNLIEVGNGEGPIRGSGYFPSYEYYTRALDKGWHVAPTNSQDNHKGKWFTANNARTIVVADDNSRDSIYDALREKRVYASEDTNMTIDYSVNDEVMGSSLGEVDKLNFKVKVEDKDDPIKKVSIIANGGVEVTSKEFDSNDVDWEFTLDPEYSYYYVKVVEKDKDIAVTSPVWVGDALNVGLSNATVDNDMTFPGGNVAVTAGVYNNSEKDLDNVNIEFFKNEISDKNKIGETKIDKVKGAETKNAVFNWKAEGEGDYTIYARTTINVGTKEKSFTTSVKVKVVNPENSYKILIDGAHGNQYITGDYAGKYTAFKNLLKDKNGLTIINKAPITDEILKGVKILVLTNPQSRDNSKANLKASKFEPEEIAAIKRYVENGGNLILSTRADYGDGKGEYSNGTQMNSVLEAIGTQLRVNDDEVIDNTTNGGQEYRLYLNKYSSPKYNLLDGIKNGEDQYSFYNGASIILKDGASGETVDFLVKGYETTTTKDADNQGDNVPVAMGKVNTLGVEELAGGGKVVVSGNTFFSDFEIDGTNGEKYSNLKVTNNIVNWMMPAKEIKVIKMGDIRKDENNDGVSDLYGKRVTVEGYVTSQSEAIEPKNSFFEVIYIEDETGGACVFGVSNTKLKVGQKVRITGTVDAYQGELEISLADRISGSTESDVEAKNVKIIDEDISEVTPTKLSTKDSMLPANGGKLVQVKGKVVDMNESNLYIDDGTGKSRVYVEGYIWDGINKNMLGKWDTQIKIGDTVSAIGLASADPEGGRLRVRNTGEIKLANDEDINEDANVVTKQWIKNNWTRKR